MRSKVEILGSPRQSTSVEPALVSGCYIWDTATMEPDTNLRHRASPWLQLVGSPWLYPALCPPPPALTNANAGLLAS